MSDAPDIPTIPDLEGMTRAEARRQRLFFALWPDDGVRMDGFGFYEDSYVRVGEGWKFASRRLNMTHYAEVGASGAKVGEF